MNVARSRPAPGVIIDLRFTPPDKHSVFRPSPLRQPEAHGRCLDIPVPPIWIGELQLMETIRATGEENRQALNGCPNNQQAPNNHLNPDDPGSAPCQPRQNPGEVDRRPEG